LATFQPSHGRVAQADADVAEGLHVEQTGGVVGAVGDEAGLPVDGQRAGAVGGIGDPAGVDGQGFGLEDVVSHYTGLRALLTRVSMQTQFRPPNRRAYSNFTQRSIAVSSPGA
jgi:hypothetical protein